MKWNPAGNDRVVICLDIIVGIIRLCIDMELISIARISPPSWAKSIIFTLLIDDVFPSPLMMISPQPQQNEVLVQPYAGVQDCSRLPPAISCISYKPSIILTSKITL